MTERHPIVERYLERLQAGLATMPAADREEVVRDIRSHVAEATKTGASLESILTGLGPADALARAYTVELWLNPAPAATPVSRAHRFFALTGLLALTSIPTLVIVTTLASVGFAFMVAGLVTAGAGIIDAIGITLPFLDGPASTEHPALTLTVGPLLMVGGVVALWGLVKYLRWLAHTIRQALPAPLTAVRRVDYQS